MPRTPVQAGDIAIVGGGLVGLCAALAMQHPARRVRIIEAAPPGPQSGGLNARSIALSISSVQIFRALGVWPRLSEDAHPIRQIQISSRGHWGVTRLHAGDYDLEALGYVVENNVLARVLLEAVENSERIELEQGASFESISQADRVAITYRAQKRKKRLDAQLALIADGADSSARAALGIAHRRIDYGQSAVVVNVEVGKPLAGIAYERFTTGGPLAMLPLGGRRYACVWTCSPSRAEALRALPETEFAAELQAYFGFRLGPVERVGERVAIELRRTRADRLHCGRCLLVGNAANALHPVAGQSFNMSLRDIACLHELLAERELADLDGERWRAIAEDYQQRRESEHRRVIGYGDGLVTLFSNSMPVFDRLRACGLAALDLLPPLKAQAAFAGMGLAFGGNRLLRGRL